jgi:hypothetical protein
MDIEAAYTSALASLVSRFRTSLYAPEIPLYIVQTGNEIHADDGGYGHVRAAQESVAKTLPHAYIVSRESVAFPATGMQRSGSEFIPAGYQQLATVAADNIARLQKGEAIRTGEAQGLYSVTGIAPRTLEFIGFVNEANSCTASQYSLEYGDGNIFPIQVSKNTCGPYAFITTHAYTAPGMYSVSLKDTKGALLQKSPYSVE